jgi:ferredoxin
VRISVDFDRCQSNGVCMDKAPEVFEVRADGSLSVLVEEPDRALHPRIKEAARRCPTRAITVEG